MQDEHYLKLALEAAKEREGFCAPNPAVGAVVVKDGTVLSIGAHQACGQPHAEVEALKPLGEKARGATLYISLEPCCHWGRTPPCTDLIRENGLARVVYSHADPNPKVFGGGEKALHDAGIVCERKPQEDSEAFYEPYDYWTRTGLPYVVGKLALSLDGRSFGPEGEPITLTGKDAARFTHEGRRRADAILTSYRTIKNDNPRLNARTENGVFPKALFILDSRAETPSEARVFENRSPVVILHADHAPSENLERLRDRGAETICVPQKTNRLSLPSALETIGKKGIHQLWVEAGPTVFHALREEGHLSRLLLYVAPQWIGRSNLSGLGAPEWKVLGQDAICELRRET